MSSLHDQAFGSEPNLGAMQNGGVACAEPRRIYIDVCNDSSPFRRFLFYAHWSVYSKALTEPFVAFGATCGPPVTPGQVAT